LKRNEKTATINSSKKIILVTLHRRELTDKFLGFVCEALKELASRDDIQLVVSVHPNPVIRASVIDNLDQKSNILLIEPLDYFDFIYLMEKCFLIVSDSGGIQEEANSIGKPVIVIREVTERQEAVEFGTALLCGFEPKQIVETATLLLEGNALYLQKSKENTIFGDGKASEKILEILANKELKL
jgi:UDP-N-acetylglucosamine 2-epimerase (non-hydrolysing)